MQLVASICPPVCPYVYFHSIFWTDWPLSLSFVCVRASVRVLVHVDLDCSSPGFESKGHWSKVMVRVEYWLTFVAVCFYCHIVSCALVWRCMAWLRPAVVVESGACWHGNVVMPSVWPWSSIEDSFSIGRVPRKLLCGCFQESSTQTMTKRSGEPAIMMKMTRSLRSWRRSKPNCVHWATRMPSCCDIFTNRPRKSCRNRNWRRKWQLQIPRWGFC